jgi:hypothetical protein
MGRQINYYMTAEDHRAFEQRLRRAGDFVAIRRKSKKRGPQVVDLSSALDAVYLCLVRRGDLPAVIAEEIPARGEYFVNELYSPVVQYTRCSQGDRVIRPGRLYTQEGYFDDAGRWVVKDEAFIAWSRRLQATARRFFKGRRYGSFYLGEGAERAKASGFELTQV